MANEMNEQTSEEDLFEGELDDQNPLEPVTDPSARLTGYNQIPDFGDDTEGTLQEFDDGFSEK